MRAIRPSASYPPADIEQSRAPVTVTIDVPGAASRIDWDAVKTASRSCCCPARPAVIAVLPAVPGRPHRTDLLLCMHHFRISQAALRAAGALVIDEQRRIIGADAALYLSPS